MSKKEVRVEAGRLSVEVRCLSGDGYDMAKQAYKGSYSGWDFNLVGSNGHVTCACLYFTKNI